MKHATEKGIRAVLNNSAYNFIAFLIFLVHGKSRLCQIPSADSSMLTESFFGTMSTAFTGGKEETIEILPDFNCRSAIFVSTSFLYTQAI